LSQLNPKTKTETKNKHRNINTGIMKPYHPNNKAIMTLVAAVGVLAARPGAAQTTIIDDTFTDANYVALAAHLPDVNLTGNLWTDSGSYWGAGVIYNNAAQLNTDRGAGISLQGYSLPGSTLTLSADLNPNGIGASSGANYRGVFLGFYTSPTLPTTHGYNALLGLLLDPTTGSVSLADSLATGNAENIISSQSYTLGTWTENEVHTLSYTIDTTSGSILGASLTDANGTENYSFTTGLFTDSSLDWVGAAVSAPAGNETGIIDNFSLVATPEPGAWALMSGGLAMMLGVGRLRRS
jgi:hypothetical protein